MANLEQVALCVALCVAIVAGELACGPRHAVPRPATAPPPAQPELAARALEGPWSWSHVSETDGVRRIEQEWWELAASERGELRGSYLRQVSYLAIDGRPFTCSQTATYQSLVRYDLEGAIEGGEAVLFERSYEVAPSVCERGFRRLGGYRGQLRGEGLELRFGDRLQTLQRRAGVPPPWPSAAAVRADGRYRWAGRSHDDNRLTTVEREDWQLSEDAGVVTGHYDREVSVYAEDGHRIPCAGAPAYHYRDRFEVRASFANGSLHLQEVAVEAAPHPCLQLGKRHLDSAVVTLYPDELEFEWRGRRRQVLTRVVDPRAPPTPRSSPQEPE